MSTTYSVIYSPQAFLDLTGLYEYIRFNLQVPKTAEKQVNRIKHAIRSLETMPMRYQLVEWEPWCSKEIRRVPVDNYTVFYQVDENQMTVTVIRIFYSGRNIENIDINEEWSNFVDKQFKADLANLINKENLNRTNGLGILGRRKVLGVKT